MTTIRTTCEHCGDIELLPEDLELELHPGSAAGAYTFDCPYCVTLQRRTATARVVSILLATGVCYTVEPKDAGETLANPIAEEEIAAFVAALDRDDWFDKLATS